MGLSLDRWEGVADAERAKIARQVAAELPTGFVLDSIQPFRLGECHHHVALFRGGSRRFAFIPAGTVSFGFDAARPWEPTPEEQESWRSSADAYELKGT